MSIESAKAFIDKMKTDEEFAKRIMECKDEVAWMAVVKEEGYDFPTAELGSVQGVVTDQELDAVAGGFSSNYAAFLKSKI